ncbi:Long chain acyl-CoA synthetase 7, peroxisomal [Grifola frondosa]|uniref:Long chain acyl-CoA synthetase 7, peroxisomal n=1 Tax=Grifola frondosa TaxID=5627 RepID=A0A1C7MGK0_GRIFR|nr:Long chain acyl-CoA synthetase 7, peroxisomal [Grifola frondosa]
MGYTAEDKPYPRGEIHMRGSQVFKGYYKDEQKTREALDDEGWLHTGDVGLLDDSLRLKIIDRVKNIMKLSQGEYVALEHVENIYSACPLVSQLFVYGDSLQSYLLAVVIPDIPHFAPLASRVLGKSINDTDTVALERAVKDPEVYSAVMAELGKQAKKNKLKGFEMIKRIHLTLEPFTTENGCLTPTMKIRRKETYGKFKPELDALYALPEPTSSKL